MRQATRTNCMAMHRSDPRSGAPLPHRTGDHAGEVAQWVLLLLGWLWLGEQGMRWGWSLASGVLAVALWWAARLLCRGSGWALHARPWVMAVCGGLSALGVGLPEALRSLDVLGWQMPHAGLLAVALLWGAWSGMVETRSRVSTFDLGPLAWHPVLAAGLVAGLWWGAGQRGWGPWGVGVLLAVCTIVLHARDKDRAQQGAAIACRGLRASVLGVLPPSAMGLMMGSLWLGNVWCAGLGWTPSEMVLWHLAMMAVLPALVAWLGHLPVGFTLGVGDGGASSLGPRRLGDHLGLRLALLVGGALMLWGQSAWSGLLAMLLPSLAWALHCCRPRSAFDRATAPSATLWWRQSLSLLLGPGLLVCVGAASSVHGPLAMQTAMGLIGWVAAVQAFFLWTRQPMAMATLSAP